MKKHFQYFRYVLVHKWYVFIECCKLGIPWRGIVHDLSKFLPDEWTAYVCNFYGGSYLKASEIWRRLPGYSGPTKESVKSNFDLAWLHHQKRNRHHWQYWALVQDDDADRVLPMPDKYRREMLADWRGAGRAITSEDNTAEWYSERRERMKSVLHPETRRWIEEQLGL